MDLRRLVLIVTPYAWLLFFFLIPFGIVMKIALSDYAVSIPPYTPQLDLSQGWEGVKSFFHDLDFENFTFLASDCANSIAPAAIARRCCATCATR